MYFQVSSVSSTWVSASMMGIFCSPCRFGLQAVEGAGVIDQDLPGDIRGDGLLIGQFLYEAEGAHHGGLIRVAVVGPYHQTVLGARVAGQQVRNVIAGLRGHVEAIGTEEIRL